MRRIIDWVWLTLGVNWPLLCWYQPEAMRGKWPLLLILVALYLIHLWRPQRYSAEISRRLRWMMGGQRLMVDAAVLAAVELCLYGYLLVSGAGVLWLGPAQALLGFIIAAAVIWVMAVDGFFRIVFLSSQLGILLRLALFFLWWLPGVNLILLAVACHKVRREYFFELSKEELNQQRQESQICRTKYPLVLVHGIFFRDWQYLNYWGRIPKELSRNGAAVYYGQQQSAAPVAVSAAELTDRIRQIVQETGCGKVNIIAHSKGGLDSRYAISQLELGEMVASLTTVNTPHRGCKFADVLLNHLPQGLIRFVAEKYNAIFRKLGDREPDFYGGVMDLRASACENFNVQVENREGVLYQSVASTMKNAFSAGFPLCFTWPLVRLFDGRNDGLVAPSSAAWGDCLPMISGRKLRGVSHADMVDLMRENIDGFDVCEFYVDLVSELKYRGL